MKFLPHFTIGVVVLLVVAYMIGVRYPAAGQMVFDKVGL